MTTTAAVRGAAGSASWADALLLSFAQGGYVQAHPGILQPAEPFLDLSGEDIRKRMYLTTDASGEELCLRPDLTIPVARDYLASPARRPARGLLLSRAGVSLSRRPAERIPAGRHRILRPAGPRRGRCGNAGAGAGSDHAFGLTDVEIRIGDVGLVLRADRRARSRPGLEAAADQGLQPQGQPRPRSRPADACDRAPAARISGRAGRACRLRPQGGARARSPI